MCGGDVLRGLRGVGKLSMRVVRGRQVLECRRGDELVDVLGLHRRDVLCIGGAGIERDVPGLRGRQVLGGGGCIGGDSVHQLWAGDLLGG